MKFTVLVSAAFALPRSTVAVSASIVDKTKYGWNESLDQHDPGTDACLSDPKYAYSVEKRSSEGLEKHEDKRSKAIHVEEESYSRDDVYNIDETGVNWKALPRKFILNKMIVADIASSRVFLTSSKCFSSSWSNARGVQLEMFRLSKSVIP
ncbi:hypothetical protein TNCV_4606751 [Trichonephila clavipes]|nr:hypothetical protein TNCV_4606751 [Trichonephila clavipes]